MFLVALLRLVKGCPTLIQLHPPYSKVKADEQGQQRPAIAPRQVHAWSGMQQWQTHNGGKAFHQHRLFLENQYLWAAIREK